MGISLFAEILVTLISIVTGAASVKMIKDSARRNRKAIKVTRKDNGRSVTLSNKVDQTEIKKLLELVN